MTLSIYRILHTEFFTKVLMCFKQRIVNSLIVDWDLVRTNNVMIIETINDDRIFSRRSSSLIFKNVDWDYIIYEICAYLLHNTVTQSSRLLSRILIVLYFVRCCRLFVHLHAYDFSLSIMKRSSSSAQLKIIIDAFFVFVVTYSCLQQLLCESRDNSSFDESTLRKTLLNVNCLLEDALIISCVVSQKSSKVDSHSK